eukprot:COSAG05_NODE_149_length_16213_cov_66.750279_12_plen_37_part_00
MRPSAALGPCSGLTQHTTGWLALPALPASTATVLVQ